MCPRTVQLSRSAVYIGLRLAAVSGRLGGGGGGHSDIKESRLDFQNVKVDAMICWFLVRSDVEIRGSLLLLLLLLLILLLVAKWV